MQLFNSLTRKKETFTPRVDGQVTMYVCGITTYDLSHIGHGRSAAVFDVLVRYLRHTGLNVTFIRNFTDVDDKIIKRAAEEHSTSEAVAEKNIRFFYEDMDALGMLRPDIEPRCTEHIPEMIRLTERLIEKGHAYPTPSGDVYFRVRSFAPYGKLSGRDVDDLKAGARIAPGEEKEDPLDFALWKAAKPGEPMWDSPWGKGRPGWHLECSAMSEKYVPLPLDIHGGGQDLVFPHHENEIAQSEAAFDTPLSRFWVHNGFVQINQEKMSKSLGNFFTIREVLKQFLPETLRFLLLSVHYRSPLDFSFDALEEAEKAQKRIYSALAQVAAELARAKWTKAPLPETFGAERKDLETKWNEALADDLNTAAALGHVFGLVRLAGRILDDKTLRKTEGARELLTSITDDIATFGSVLGLFTQEPAAFLSSLRDMRAARKQIDLTRVQTLLATRAAARGAKDFATSDTVRDELAGLGVEVKDTPQGQTWDVA